MSKKGTSHAFCPDSVGKRTCLILGLSILEAVYIEVDFSKMKYTWDDRPLICSVESVQASLASFFKAGFSPPFLLPFLPPVCAL